MLMLSEWERENFSASSKTPELTVIFPSREIYFSPELLNKLRLNPDTCPRTLDQWYELCHPEDHTKNAIIEREIYGHENFISLTRKLYCGDGFYRSFRLDAFIQRKQDSGPQKLIGTETLALSAWLESASEGERIECDDLNGSSRILEAVRIQGVMTLKDVGEIEDLQQENIRLRHEIQRRIFANTSAADFIADSSNADDAILRNELEENINAAINILTGNNQLKALRRSMNEANITVGIAGLTSSGKSSFMNALLGEKLIPEQTRATTNVPIICREGETRGAKIFYQDGRSENIQGKNLTSSFMKNIASEKINAGNKEGISRIEIVMPGALIPEGICFVDTPGADSLAGSGGAALRNILPEFDVIIYVMPLRSRLKGSDYEFLRTILGINKRIIFVLSQIDLERDDTEAGRIIKSSHDKILSDITALRDDMQKFSGRDFDVIPVSSKNALEKFYDRKSPEWINANIESIFNYFEKLSRNYFARALVFRAERTLNILEGISERKEITASSAWKIQDIAENLKHILRTYDNMPEKTSGYYFDINMQENRAKEKNLLSSLIESMREREFRKKFFSLHVFKNKNRAVLLGAERNQSMKLFSRIAHNILLENLPDGGASRKEWLFSGNTMPFACIKLPALSTSENILIAPSDLDIMNNNMDWHKLFASYVPVVSVDISRVDSGLSDLAYSPYITGLALSEWVLAFGNAGLFDTRQADLISQVPERVKEFAALYGLKNPEWFIFENYKIF